MAKNKLIEFLKKTPSWQRFTLSLLGVIILVTKWQWSVWHLYSIPEHAMTAFTTITTNNDYVIGAIVIFMVTGKLIYDWKNSTASTIIEQSQHLSEKIQEDRNENITIKEERIEHVYVEGEPGTPEKRPFSKIDEDKYDY